MDLWRQLEQAGSSFVLLNNPGRVLLRYELLRMLHAKGRNRFNVHRPARAFREARFPVFLHSMQHEGPLSPIVSNRLALARWLFRRVRPRRWNKLIVEEFCNVATPEGLYSKYGAFNMGGQIVPRHLFFGKNWCLKDTEILGLDEIVEFQTYLRENPHEEQLKEIFALSGIDYGRIDYAFYEGRLQVWEINTNPMIIGFLPDFISIEMIKPHLHRLSACHEEEREMSYRLAECF